MKGVLHASPTPVIAQKESRAEQKVVNTCFSIGPSSSEHIKAKATGVRRSRNTESWEKGRNPTQNYRSLLAETLSRRDGSTL